MGITYVVYWKINSLSWSYKWYRTLHVRDTPRMIYFTSDSFYIFDQIYAEEEATGAVCMAYVLFDAMQTQQKGLLTIPSSLKCIVTGT